MLLYENNIHKEANLYGQITNYRTYFSAKTAFIASVNVQGFPVIRAMLAPRIIDGSEIYFSTNTSSKKIKQYTANNKACVYFYKRGKFKYQGVCITGEMEVCTDQPTKDMIWCLGDKMFYKQGVTDPDYCVLKFK